jgi:hypothetical protein
MIIKATYWNGCHTVTETYQCAGYIKPNNALGRKKYLVLGKDIIILSAKKVKE